MPERGETPRLKTVLEMLGRAGVLRGRVMLVKAGREMLGAVGTIDEMSVVRLWPLVRWVGRCGGSVRKFQVCPRVRLRGQELPLLGE